MSKIEEALRRARSTREQTVGTRSEQPALRHAIRGRPTTRAQSRELVGLTAAEEIAHMREGERRDAADLTRRGIIHTETEDTRVSDSFRHIRTALLRKSGGKNFVLAVTSAASDGGASFVAANLAASFAFDENKTAMLLDANLREPRFNDLLLDQGNRLGLTDYLAGDEEKVENIIHPVGIPRMRLVPAGTKSHSAMEYFTTPRLGQLLQEIRQRYRERFVIIDTPPIMDAADARILSELCDYTLLVVPYGKVTSTQVEAAAETIGQEKLAGCVMNNETRLPLWKQGKRAAG